jgi:hypothetical protein
MKLAARKRNSAQGLIEFAIILPLLLLMLILIFDIGRSIYAYSVINNAAREGARSGIIKPYDTVLAEQVAMHLTSGLDVTHITVNINAPSTSNFFEVEVRYTFEAATPYLGRLLGSANNSITLVGHSIMTKEQ